MWLRILRVVVKTFDMIGGTIRGVFMGVNAVIGSFIAAWINNFQQLGNAVRALMAGDVDGIKDAIKNNLTGYKEAALNAGEVFGKAFQAEVLRQSDSGLESVLDKWIAEAQKISRERTAAAAATGGGTAPTSPTNPTGGGDSGASKAAKELEKLKDALAVLS